MGNFVNVLWVILSTFVFLAYLMVMFQIVVDLVRDPTLGGGSKALWIAGLIFLPILTALVYLVVRGRGMTERQRAATLKSKAEMEHELRSRVGTSTPADQIVKAKGLLDSGIITQDEFLALKGKALA